MTDQTTPITDDDRKAHEWASSPARQSNGLLAPVARAILAHVPAPPKSLAEEIREAGWNGLGDKIMAERFADRVEAIEKARDKAQQDAVDAWEHAAQTDREHVRIMELREQDYVRVASERDEARAEVERLTAERDGAREEIAWLRNGPGHTEVATDLPSPADVPEGEPYDIYYGVYGEDHTVGVRIGGQWLCIGDNKGVRVTDQNIARLTRLVPDTRRVIDKVEGLDALPVGSIVLDGIGRACTKISPEIFRRSDGLILTASQCFGHGPVTVIHEPEVTA